MRVGFFLSSEQHAAPDLVAQAQGAERAGFAGLWISDHFHPCNDAPGHSPFVWSTIGAIAQATERTPLTTGVTCPTVRIHPAVIAHAAATSATLMEGRFNLGVALARRSPSRSSSPASGRGRSSWPSTSATASARPSRRRRRPQLPQLLPVPAHFEQACELVDEDMVAGAIPCGPDLGPHLERLERYEQAGFHEVYVRQVGPDHAGFFAAYEREILRRYPAAG